MILFSGRFDPLHPGHIVSIMRLANEYGGVRVVALDYESRKVPVSYSVQILQEIFSHTDLNVDICKNDIHFGKITKEEIEKYQPFDLFAAGNLSVLKHVEGLGVKTLYIDRAYHYSARDIVVVPDE